MWRQTHWGTRDNHRPGFRSYLKMRILAAQIHSPRTYACASCIPCVTHELFSNLDHHTCHVVLFCFLICADQRIQQVMHTERHRMWRWPLSCKWPKGYKTTRLYTTSSGTAFNESGDQPFDYRSESAGKESMTNKELQTPSPHVYMPSCGFSGHAGPHSCSPKSWLSRKSSSE